VTAKPPAVSPVRQLGPAALWLLASLPAVAGVAASCGDAAAPSPFELFDPGVDAAVGGSGAAADAGPDADPTLGGPCTVDSQCDDDLDCTFDACDEELHRCRFTPDDSLCQNDVYCDGVEICDLALGCRPGAPITCSDGDPCVINTCNEATKLCESTPRDVDQDGDPDEHCTGGGDCDDLDPMISSLRPEVCANSQDDNCDGVVDEAACLVPQHDTCLDPLEISAPGSYTLSTAAANLDYAASCGVAEPTLARDVVAAILLAPGPPVDVQLTARTANADLALALLGQCGFPASEIACSPGYDAPNGQRLAKLRGRLLGSEQQETALPAYLFAAGDAAITLELELLPPAPKPANETCGSAAVLVPSVPAVASLIDAATDLGTACDQAATGELVYRFELTATADVELFASSLDGDGWPVISLRSDACAAPEDEITCQAAESVHIYRHSLPPGTYYAGVAATAPTDVSLTLELSPPTPQPADDLCTTAPALTPNVTFDVLFSSHQDDIASSCITGAVDAAYALELSQASDVLLVGRRASQDKAAVALFPPDCDDPAGELACGIAALSPVRAAVRNLPAGSYRVVAESEHGQPMELSAFVRPAVPPTIVPFADSCADVLAIPAAGGFFQGTTANATADFTAGCDQGASGPNGAPDQILSLQLSTTKRVLLSMAGSAYATLLDVRSGPACPGAEVLSGCAAGYYPERSFLDLELGAGTYYIQIDGFGGASGPWFLDVHVVDP